MLFMGKDSILAVSTQTEIHILSGLLWMKPRDALCWISVQRGGTPFGAVKAIILHNCGFKHPSLGVFGSCLQAEFSVPCPHWMCWVFSLRALGVPSEGQKQTTGSFSPPTTGQHHVHECGNGLCRTINCAAVLTHEDHFRS